MNVLNNLRFIGYDVAVNEGNIKLLYIGEGLPDKSRVIPLIQELRANKSEVIKELQKGKNISDETLQDLFLETMTRINDVYVSGTIKYIQEHHKDLDETINKADDRINEVWKECNKGGASIEDFKEALASYENFYLQAISLYKKFKQF